MIPPVLKWISALLFASLVFPVMADKTCSYSTYRWNTNTKQAEERQTVSKPYHDLSSEERDASTGCSVCEEDQRWIQVGQLEPVRMCRVLAERVERILNQVLARGFQINQLVAYRVGMTRGDVDKDGKRTRFSNHSFGVAIDINADSNGLYQNCMEYNENCTLRRGGEWRPGQNPDSITAGGELVTKMKSAGFKWGGEIGGRQKDFMHFSPSGY